MQDYYNATPSDGLSFRDRRIGGLHPFKDKYLIEKTPVQGNPRFSIFDSDGEVEFEYTRYPDFSSIGYDDPNIVGRMFFGRSRISIKPDNTKFVITMGGGAMLEIFSLAGDTISLIKEKRFYPPKYELTNKIANPIASLPGMVPGFLYVCATDSYIYASFSDKLQGVSGTTDHYLYVFDWEGNPVKSYKIAGGLRCFDVDVENKRVYFAKSDAEKGELFGYFDILE